MCTCYPWVVVLSGFAQPRGSANHGQTGNCNCRDRFQRTLFMLSFDGGQGQREWYNDGSSLALARNPGKMMPHRSWLLYSDGKEFAA